MQVSSCSILKRHRRNAVAGVLAAVLIFALIFTAGIGYYAYESQANLVNSQAELAKLAADRQSNQEQLGLAVSTVSHGPNNVSLALQVYNVGGITTTITAIFVTNAAAVTGGLLTNYAGSPYLVGTPALNMTLPLSLVVGASTAAIGRSIMISSNAYDYAGGTVYVNVLTSLGNVFSAQYPPPAPTISVTTTAPTTSISTAVTSVTTTSISSTTSSWTTLLTSTGSVQGFAVGTNSLVVAMDACSGTGTTTTTFGTTCVVVPAIYQGDEVILQVSVTNFAPVALSTDVVFQSVGTNGASVTSSSGGLPSSYNCASGTTPAQTIPADTGTPTTSTFTCTFSANIGNTAGTVTFIGYAVGTYTGVLGPVSVTSAEASSNMLQLGYSASGVTGPWIANPSYFRYASEEHTAFSSAAILSASNNYDVMYQVQLTNTANVSLTVLQYSFMIYFNFAEQEMDFYIVSNTAWSSTLSPYNCVSNSPTAPSGSSCTVGGKAQQNCTSLGSGCVPVGATTTITLAACSPAGTYFMWAALGGGDTNSACSANNAKFEPTEGEVGFIVVEYAFYNPKTSDWSTFAQTLPLEATYIST